MKKGKMFEMTLFNKLDLMFGAKFYSSELDAILLGFKLREGIYIGAFGFAIELNWKLRK